jgi:integrase
VQADGLTVRDLCNRFLTTKRLMMDAGELSARTWQGYFSACERVVTVFGKTRLVVDLAADDFERLRGAMDKTLGHAARMVEIQRTRMIFKYGFDEGLIDRPVRFGTAFKAPRKQVLQKDRLARGSKMLEAAEIRAMIGKAGPYLKAMILLGVNCGYGNNDCATLTFSALDLEGGWITHPRPKTGAARRAKLWPETVAALREAIAKRRTPCDPEYANLVFITQHGLPWVRLAGGEEKKIEERRWTDSVTCLCRILLNDLGIRRPGVNFYSLRRVTETIGGDSKDQVAVDFIMGHSRGDMASTYRQRIEDDRLEAVAEHIHTWLFSTVGKETQP